LLTGQRILITGANGGIGKAICEILLQNNAKLVLFYNKNKTQVDKLLEKYGNDSIEIHEVDLLNIKKIENVMNLISSSDKIDCFIHSVTIPIENKEITKLQWEDYQSHIDIQTRSFLQIVQSLMPNMKEKKQGRIISILTSYTIGRPPNNMSPYIVGKYSLLGLSKSLAVELGPYGITVNCISPSMTNTALIEKLPSKLKEITASQVPLGRLAEPKDVASMVLFVCSRSSDYISGENFLVTGGQTMH